MCPRSPGKAIVEHKIDISSGIKQTIDWMS